MTSPSDYIELREGPALPTAALNLALALESRDHAIGVRDGKLTVSDGSKLSAQDREDVKRWRLHLMALVDYCAKGVEPR